MLSVWSHRVGAVQPCAFSKSRTIAKLLCTSLSEPYLPGGWTENPRGWTENSLFFYSYLSWGVDRKSGGRTQYAVSGADRKADRKADPKWTGLFSS